jgi:signal transduction histidine kinase
MSIQRIRTISALRAPSTAARRFERHDDPAGAALLEERERIARDLHDVVIQRVLAVGMTLETLNLTTTDPAAPALLTHAVDELEVAIKEIRTTIFGLQTPADAKFGSLRNRTTALVEQAAGVLGFMPALRMEGAVGMTVQDALADDVSAVLREALSNVARHAHASHVGIVLSVTDDLLTLSIEDDGIGVSTVGRRSGVRNMQARAHARGGEFRISSREPRGTRVSWQVPCKCAQEAAAASS